MSDLIGIQSYSLRLKSTSDWASVTLSNPGYNDIVITTVFSSGSGVTISSDKKTLQAGKQLSFDFQSRQTDFDVATTGGLINFVLGHGVGGHSQTDNGGYAELFLNNNGKLTSLGSSKADGGNFYGAALQ